MNQVIQFAPGIDKIAEGSLYPLVLTSLGFSRKRNFTNEGGGRRFWLSHQGQQRQVGLVSPL